MMVLILMTTIPMKEEGEEDKNVEDEDNINSILTHFSQQQEIFG